MSKKIEEKITEIVDNLSHIEQESFFDKMSEHLMENRPNDVQKYLES
jgi:hypothetical protein